MYITISPQQLKPGSSTSVAKFVDYLEKENTGRTPEGREFFFNQTRENISPETVISSIDGNTAKLKTTEPRYYSISINPSSRELAHLQNDPEKMKAYTRELMKDYARAFNREIDGRPVQVSDIKYYAKIEFSRNFRYRDKEVIENSIYLKQIAKLQNQLSKVQRGEQTGSSSEIQKEIQALHRQAPHRTGEELIRAGLPKPGDQMHVHLVVSRKDQSNSVSLSPGSKYKASEVTFNGKTVKRGFDRDRFFQAAEKTFDQQFGYHRKFVEHYDARKTQIQSPKQYYSQLLKLPVTERKEAMGILNPARFGVSNIPDARVRFALKQFQKAIELGRKSSSIEY